MNLRWLLLRSLLSKKSKAFEPVAQEATEKARLMATERLNEQRGFLFTNCLSDIDLAKYVADQGELLQISFELQFLWGLFQEHVQNYDLPANEHDRVKIHLIDWLVTFRGYQLQHAVQEVNEIERLYNKCDPVFEAISGAGKRSYAKCDEACMFRVYKALMDQRMPA